MKKHCILFNTLMIFIVFGWITAQAQQTTKVKKVKENRIERLKHETMMLRDPATGKIPLNMREKELNYVYSSRARLLPSLNPNARTTGGAFSIRGPYNVGGRTRALGVDTRNTSIIMIGGASGGLYRSTNGGTSWTMVSSPNTNPSITGIAQDPINQDTWYYTTGEAIGTVSTNMGGATYLGDGVFKSTDNGATWSQLSSTKPTSSVTFGGGTRAEWQFCHDIVIDPINSAVLVANFKGVYRSTDGGTSWTQVLDAKASFTTDLTQMDVLKTGVSSKVYYAGTHSSGTNKGFFTSTDGITWTKITSPGSMPTSWERIEVAIAPSNSNIVWFFVSNQSKTYKLYKYEAGGAGWTDRSANLPAVGGNVGNLNTQGSYNMIMSVKPDNENYVFIGGTSLYRSSDGFATAVNTNNTGNSRWIGGYSPDNDISRYPNHHPDIHSFIFMPNSNTEVLCGHDGGVSKGDITATDGTPTGRSKPHPVTWTALNNGYYTTQAYSIAIDPTTSGDNRLIMGFQDNGNWSVNATGSTSVWGEEVGGGDGCYTAIVAGKNIRYISTQNGSVARIEGTDPQNPTSNNHVHPSKESIASGGYNVSGQLFVNPFILDKNDQKIMYYPAGTELWRHKDVESINTGWNFSGTKATGWEQLTSASIGSGKISVLAVSKSTANVLYYGTTDGQLYKLTNANTGTSPTRTNIYTGKGFPSGAHVSCIAVDEEDANNVFVTFSNYKVKSVFHSTDGGSNWTDVSGNLEENTDGSGNGASVRWLAIHKPATGNKLYYAGTSTGLYFTNALNGTSTSWTQVSADVIGNVPVSMIKTRSVDGLIAVGTHGKGAFSATVTDGNNTNAPIANTLLPANNGTNISVATNLVITFNENVAKGTGNITIKKDTDDAVVATIDVTSSQVSVSNATVTIDPTNNLATSTKFYVEVASGAFKNGSGTSFAGISGKNSWAFTTSSSAVGISSSLQQLLKIYPNPTSRQVSIRLEKLNVELAKAELYNSKGELVAEKLLRQVRNNDVEGGLDVSKLPKGTYVLKVITPKQVISRTLVVQ
ncbi:Ig-like domain-containing protein [Microscilla marina]|nr:Ig-like domain-containing protein [Microscilla marina]